MPLRLFLGGIKALTATHVGRMRVLSDLCRSETKFVSREMGNIPGILDIQFVEAIQQKSKGKLCEVKSEGGISVGESRLLALPCGPGDCCKFPELEFCWVQDEGMEI